MNKLSERPSSLDVSDESILISPSTFGILMDERNLLNIFFLGSTEPHKRVQYLNNKDACFAEFAINAISGDFSLSAIAATKAIADANVDLPDLRAVNNNTLLITLRFSSFV